MWFIILLVLALSAFFIVKAVKAQAQRKQAEQDRLAEGSGLAGTLKHEGHDGQNSAGIEHDSATAQALSAGAGEAQASTGGISSTATSAVSSATDHAADAASRAVSAAGDAANTITGKGAATVAAAVGAAAAGGAAAVSAGSEAAQNASASVAGSLASMTTQGVSTGDPLHDIQEMIKILNLAEPDAGRLAISREEFTAIRQGNAEQIPSSDSLTAIADKLQHMLA